MTLSITDTLIHIIIAHFSCFVSCWGAWSVLAFFPLQCWRGVGDTLLYFSLFQLTCQFTCKGINFVCDLLGPSDNLKYEYTTSHLIFIPQDTSGLFFIDRRSIVWKIYVPRKKVGPVAKAINAEYDTPLIYPNVYPWLVVVVSWPLIALDIAYFFPDFLIPWLPAFIGPLPLAFSCMSFSALASKEEQNSQSTSCPNTREEQEHTSPLLLLKSNLILIHLLLLFLRSLQGLNLAT